MNFLRRYYLEREAKRLESEIQTSHAANDYLKIVSLFWELEDTQKAEEFRRKAMKRHPNIEFKEPKNSVPESNPSFNLSAEISRILEEIKAKPNPWLYGKLARLFVNSGELGRAEETAQKAVTLYKNHPYPYTILAEIAVLSNDRRKALTLFGQAVQFDSQSAISITHMSLYYNEVKDFERTRKLLEQLLVPHIVGTTPPVPPAPKAPVSAKKEEEVKKSGKSGRVEKAPAIPPQASDNPKAFELINQFRTLKYFQGALVLDHSLNILGVDLPFSLKEDEVKKALSNLWQSTMSQSKQMDLGEFQYTAFEGESGGFFIVQSPEYVIGLLFDKRRRLDQDQQKLFEFCADLF